MEYTKSSKDSLRARNRQNRRTERVIQRDIEDGINAYHDWFKKQLQFKEPPITILAEGDSWFNYSLAGEDVIDHLQRLLRIKIENLSAPGDEAREMLSGRQKARLERELQQGPDQGLRYDFLLFSGGGNDLVGKDRFYRWFHDYKKGMQPKEVLNDAAITRALNLLGVSYKELIKIRDTHSPKTHIIFNAYDFAVPNGKGVCGYGPWLKCGLKQRKIPKAMRREVVKLLLKKFARSLDSLARKHQRITVAQTQGTLPKKKHWDNEIHPTSEGFKKIARIFQQEIKKLS